MKENKMNCPLCKSKNIKVLEVIDKNELNKLYRVFTDRDFSYLLVRDLTYKECQECQLRYYDPLIVGDENFYNSLQKFDWYYMDEKDEYFEAKKYINPSDKVLEVGSGKGAFAKYITTEDYIGLDFSENAKKMAFKNGITIENETIENYARDNSNIFDVVVSFQVLEHVPNPKSFIESKLKVLKPGGKMIIAVPSEDSFLRYVNKGILNMPPHHVTRWSDNTLKYIAQEYNLLLLDIYHEKVQENHKLWYLSTLIENSFLKNKLIDNSISRKIYSRLGHLLSRLLIKGLKNEMLPNGHTVLAVYKKQ